MMDALKPEPLKPAPFKPEPLWRTGAVLVGRVIFADLLCDLLETIGCTVIGPAPNVERGLALSRDEQLDGAFLDINFGGDYCFPIAVSLAKRGVPFLFLTGYDDVEIVPADLRHMPRLRKPFDLDELTRIAAYTFCPEAAPGMPQRQN